MRKIRIAVTLYVQVIHNASERLTRVKRKNNECSGLEWDFHLYDIYNSIILKIKPGWIMVVSIAVIHLLHKKHYHKFNTIFLDFPWIHILIQQTIILCNCLIHTGEYVARHEGKQKHYNMHKATKLVLPSNWNYCISKLLKDSLNNWRLKATGLHIFSPKWKF